MKPRVLPLTILALLLAPWPVLADVQGQLNALRQHFPEPRSNAEKNGIVLFKNGDEAFTILRVRGLADSITVAGTRDLIVLMSYLRDSDLRIRYLAAYILAHKLNVFANREPPEDAVRDLDSEAHRSMVEEFAAGIAEQGTPEVRPPAAGGRP